MEGPVIAVLVFSCNRVTVQRCLDALIKYRPSKLQFPIVVTQDCDHEPTAQVIARFGDNVTHIRVRLFQLLKNLALSNINLSIAELDCHRLYLLSFNIINFLNAVILWSEYLFTATRQERYFSATKGKEVQRLLQNCPPLRLGAERDLFQTELWHCYHRGRWAASFPSDIIYNSLAVVADDLDIAPDFFEYFLGLHPILKQDPTLFCVSAWNDNGKSSLIDTGAASLLYRTDFFPGLGWMLLKTHWTEHAPKWPPSWVQMFFTRLNFLPLQNLFLREWVFASN